MCRALGEWGLHVLNIGDTLTLDTMRGGTRYSSHVDVKACFEDMLTLVDGWRFEEGLKSSEHYGITFGLSLQKSKGIRIERTTRKYNTKKANWGQFMRNCLVRVY